MRKLIILITLLTASFLTGCRKEIVDISNIDFGSTIEGNYEIDQWLKQNFLDPYNIEVMYKWKASELSTINALVPPEEKHVIPVMEMIKKGWIDVYNGVGGSDFIKKHSPKQYLLVGSAEYNSSGGLTTGSAEGGTKIVIFRINWFDLNNSPIIKRMLKTVHHEYVHILNQKKQIPENFELISQANYTSNFHNLSDAQARELGFLTPYSASNPSEDFAELISVILTEGQAGYEAILASIASQEAVADIRAKEAVVVDYYKTYWNIDFYELIAKVEDAFFDIMPNELNKFIGTTYNHIYFDFNDPSMIGAQAQQVINASKTAFRAQGRHLNYATLYFKNEQPDAVELLFGFSPTDFSQRSQGSISFTADYDNKSSKLTLSNPIAQGDDAALVLEDLRPLLNYLTSSTFRMRFKEGNGPDSGDEVIGGMVNVKDSRSHLYGRLDKPDLNIFLGYGINNLDLHLFDEETYWSGAALEAIRAAKSVAIKPEGDGGDNRVLDYLRFVINFEAPASTKLQVKFSTTTLTSYGRQEKSYAVDFDRNANTLKFTSNSANPNLVKNSVARFEEYLTSRTFKVEFLEGSSFDTPGDSFAKISNVDDATDYFIAQLNPLPLHLAVGRSFYTSNFSSQNREDGFYFGEASMAFENMKAKLLENNNFIFSHYVLRMDMNTNLVNFTFYYRKPSEPALLNGTMTMKLNFDRVQNRLSFSDLQYTNPNARTMQDAAGIFLDYLVNNTFQFMYEPGHHYYMVPTTARGHLVDINNPNNYMVLIF